MWKVLLNGWRHGRKTRNDTGKGFARRLVRREETMRGNSPVSGERPHHQFFTDFVLLLCFLLGVLVTPKPSFQQSHWLSRGPSFSMGSWSRRSRRDSVELPLASSVDVAKQNGEPTRRRRTALACTACRTRKSRVGLCFYSLLVEICGLTISSAMASVQNANHVSGWALSVHTRCPTRLPTSLFGKSRLALL